MRESDANGVGPGSRLIYFGGRGLAMGQPDPEVEVLKTVRLTSGGMALFRVRELRSGRVFTARPSLFRHVEEIRS